MPLEMPQDKPQEEIEHWFTGVDEADLTPLELAEKAWMLAGEKRDQVCDAGHQELVYSSNLTGMPYKEKDDKEAAIKERMEVAKKEARKLWKKYVGLKPYVHDIQLEALGITRDPDYKQLNAKRIKMEKQREKRANAE